MISDVGSPASCEGSPFLYLLSGLFDFILDFLIFTGATAAVCDCPCDSAGTWMVVISVHSIAALIDYPSSSQGGGFPTSWGDVLLQ